MRWSTRFNVSISHDNHFLYQCLSDLDDLVSWKVCDAARQRWCWHMRMHITPIVSPVVDAGNCHQRWGTSMLGGSVIYGDMCMYILSNLGDGEPRLLQDYKSQCTTDTRIKIAREFDKPSNTRPKSACFHCSDILEVVVPLQILEHMSLVIQIQTKKPGDILQASELPC